MMKAMEPFDAEKLRTFLGALPQWKRIAFMASCCERMLPNYRSFNSETGYGNPKILSDALTIIWDCIESDKVRSDIADIVVECEQQAPDTEDFGSIYTSAALDAANAIAVTLEALGDATEDRAIEVAALARDTVDLYVQQVEGLDPNGPDLEREILESRYMQDELRSQAQSLEMLSGLTGERPLAAANFRSECSRLKGSLPTVTEG